MSDKNKKRYESFSPYEIMRKSAERRREHNPLPTGVQYLLMILGAFLLALGTHFFKYPNHFVMGGVEGVSVIVTEFSKLSAARLTFIMNMALLVLGFIFFGKKFLLRTGVVSIANSFLLLLFEKYFYIAKPLTENKFLEMVMAAVLYALGQAILFNFSASSGGTDIIAMILKKYTSIDIGKSVMLVNVAITISSLGLFSWEVGLLSLLGLFAKGYLIDIFINGFNEGKFFIIITDKPEEIGSFIKVKLNRSATVINGKGLYQGKDKTVFLCVTNNSESALFKSIVKSIDPNCFITILNTSSVIGKGFYLYN